MYTYVQFQSIEFLGKVKGIIIVACFIVKEDREK